MSNIVMFLSNAFRPDPRVIKEADSLAAAGYSVTIICWDRLGELAENETLSNGVRILRIQNVHSKYGAGPRQLLSIPGFWSAAIRKAMPLNPVLVHCHDLDTLYPGVQVKKKLGCKLIFDAHEDYPTLMSLYLPGFFVLLLNLYERWYLRYVDGVVAASSVYIDKLNELGLSHIVYLPNVQRLEPFNSITNEQVSRTRQAIGLEPDTYVISYIGGFSRNRLLIPLIEAMKELPNVTLLLAGDGHQRQAVEESIQGLDNIHYLGWLPADQVPLYTCLSDVVYYCLKPDYPGSSYNSPNTLSNAMAAGRAVIANELGDLGRIVKKIGCGILLKDVTALTIREAVLTLSNPVIRGELGQAGQLAAVREFNWSIVEKRLRDLYHELLNQ